MCYVLGSSLICYVSTWGLTQMVEERVEERMGHVEGPELKIWVYSCAYQLKRYECIQGSRQTYGISGIFPIWACSHYM